MNNLPAIRIELLESSTPKRLVIKVNNNTLDPQDYRASADKLVTEIFPTWETDHRILYLVIDVWSERTFIVIDINHHDYDFDTAHKTQTILPVYVLRQHRRRQTWALARWPPEDERLGAEILDLHNVNGFDPTPFLENHNIRLFHANPREFRPPQAGLLAA